VNKACIVLLTAGALQAGCNDTKPARIEHLPVSDVVYDRNAIPLIPHVVNAAGEMLEGQRVAVAASPSDVMKVDGEFLECVKSGDAVVTLAGGGLSTTLLMKCRLVAKLKASPSKLALVVGTDPTPLKVTALDDAGNAMADVPITISSSAPDVVAVRGGNATGLAVGRATLEVKAGATAAKIEAEVIEKVQSEPLALSDGQSITYTLNRGNYVVEVNVRSGDTAYGVTAAWVGADCKRQPEARSFKAKCRVNDTASIVIENPTAFGLGPSAMGNIAIYRGPL
jgi:hypothetical protein